MKNGLHYAYPNPSSTTPGGNDLPTIPGFLSCSGNAHEFSQQ